MTDLEERIKKTVIRANDLAKKSFELITNQDYASAITPLTELISLRRRGKDYELLAYCYYTIQRKDIALKLYNQAVAIDPNLDNSWKSIGHIHTDNKRPNEAIYYYERALALKPEENPYILNLSTALLSVGKFREAIPHLNKSILLDPKNEKTYHNLGVALKIIDEDVGAMEAYKTAIELNPNRDGSWIGLAYLLYQNKMFDKAFEYFDRAEEFVKQKDFIWFWKSTITVKAKNDWSGAQEIIGRIKSNFVHTAALSMIHTETSKTISGLEYALEALSLDDPNLYKVHVEEIREQMQENISKNISQHIKNTGIKDLIDTLQDNFNNNLSEHSGYVLCALFDATSHNEEYTLLSKELFKNVLRDHPLALHQLGYDSRNAVNIISRDIISQNIYIIKAAGKENPSGNSQIEREYGITRYVNSITKKTVTPILLEQGYMVEKRIRSPSLKEVEEYAESEELKEEITLCLDTLAEIYNKAKFVKTVNNNWTINYKEDFDNKERTIILSKYDRLGELKRRLFNRISNDPTALMEEYTNLFRNIQFDDGLIQSDAYKDNWLKGGYILDWERASIGDPLIDVVQLINDPEFVDMNKDELLNHYMNQTNLKTDLKEKYHALSIHNALCQIGSKINQGNIPEAQQYLEQAVNLTSGKLKDEIIKYFIPPDAR